MNSQTYPVVVGGRQQIACAINDILDGALHIGVLQHAHHGHGGRVADGALDNLHCKNQIIVKLINIVFY